MRRDGDEHRHVVAEVRLVVDLGHRLADLRAALRQQRRELVDLRLHLGRRLRERQRRHDRDPEVGQPIVARRRNVEPPRGGFERIRASHDVEQQLEVGRAASERPLHSHHDRRVRPIGQWERPRARDCRLRRAMSVHAAVGRGHTDRAADVAADLERGEAGGERRGAATGAATRSAIEVPRVVRASVDRAVGLPVAERNRDVGLAEKAAPAANTLRAIGPSPRVGSPSAV